MTVNGFKSVQVNVDENGDNIVGDAANEPTMAIDPTNPKNIVIGWRQFDSVLSDFRQSGYAYSRNGGETWTFPGCLRPGQFGSDPVLAVDDQGVFYYLGISHDLHWLGHLHRSANAGGTWDEPVEFRCGDKPWMEIDRTPGAGNGNIYLAWNYYGSPLAIFLRVLDEGESFGRSDKIPGRPTWGTVAVDPDGAVYVVGSRAGARDRFSVARSTNAQDRDQKPVFYLTSEVDLQGKQIGFSSWSPNPGGLLGQVWIACDHSGGPRNGFLYVLCSVETRHPWNRLDVMIASSSDRGQTWSEPVRVNDDDPSHWWSWQWFGTLSVAPSGRLDAAWYDTRNTDSDHLNELYYAYSIDGGATWSPNMQVAPVFDSWVGWPRQFKIGDYIQGVSDSAGMNLAYAATYNGEQDIYFVRITPDCNGNGLHDGEDIASGVSRDDNHDGVVDECQGCELIREFRVTCKHGRLRAQVRSGLPVGSRLTLDNSGNRKSVTIDHKGHGRAGWRLQSGGHDVTIVECPEKKQAVVCE